MKAVMISINPKWCDLIESGKKTVEVRKTKPKLDVPFKCYIYCTKGETIYLPRDIFGKNPLNGKVIGEFVCDGIRPEPEIADQLVDVGLMLHSCLSSAELLKYANGNALYSWHISELKIYDEPKQLSSFSVEDKKAVLSCEHREVTGQPEYKTAHGGWIRGGYICNKGAEPDWCERCRTKPIKRPPQSWCYVEEA